LNKDEQKCRPCDGLAYVKKIDIENSTSGNFSCSALPLELKRGFLVNSMDECSSLKKECIICGVENPTTFNTSTEVPDNEENETSEIDDVTLLNFLVNP
jgi:hypothetical protein